MKVLPKAGSAALALIMAVAIATACNSSGPCPRPDGTWGACNCMVSGGGSWECNEATIPACPGDAVGAFTAPAPVACSYHGPQCVYCKGGANGAIGAAVWCSCGVASAHADGGAKSFWDCSLNGYTCSGP